MFRKMFFIPATFLLIIILSACASIQLPGVTSSSVQNSTGQTIKSKMAVGILKLEDTDLSVTSTQANDLLLLWKGIKNLSSENNTSPLEIAAIYDQMQEVLSTSQVQAIKNMTITPDDLSGLMQKYGIVSVNLVSSSTKKTAASSNSGGPGGPGGDMMLMGPPSGGDPLMGGANSNTRTGAAKSGSSATNYNLLFADSVIKVLQTKAGNS